MAQTWELQAQLEALERETAARQAAAEARLAGLEAAIAVHYALSEQLAETRIRELRAENAMLHALLDARDG